MITVPMNVSVQDSISVNASEEEQGVALNIGAAYKVSEGDLYHGEYEFTPNNETQTVHTQDKLLLQNITINPVPSNYGKISWDGSNIMIE